jgi:DNA invertase Pin-like site-specific DNA recombinase
MSKRKLVAAYVRVSTVEQNEAGQRAAIDSWLAASGIDLELVRWYVDKGKSGDSLERPAFAELAAAIFAGSVGTVVVYKLDRLSRKIADGINTLAAWCDKGIRVVAVTQQIDLSGTVGQIIAAVLLGVGQMEQELRRERQAAGIAVARANGVYKGRKPGTRKAKPERALELRESGLSVSEIAKSLGVSRNTVFVYLRAGRVA